MSQDIINNRFWEESVFAIADGYCVINLTKSIVRGSMYQVVNGKKYNLNEQLGLPENSSLQSLVDAWALTIPEEGLKDFLHEFDRERLLNRFENGERHISFRYWTRTATFEPMLAEDHMALYREEKTGDVIAVNYVLDRTEHYRLEEKERALEKSNREYAKLLEEEKKHTAMIEELTKKLQSQLELFTVSIPGGVKISNDDPEYSFKYVSEQFANMLGYATPKELLDASGGNIIGLEGTNLTVARDGLQAVRMFQEKPEGYFDVILMDIMMPVMDGITAAKTIRLLKHPDAETIPIIAMTANAFREDKEKCLAAGMNAHLAKPIKIENIKRILYEYCV